MMNCIEGGSLHWKYRKNESKHSSFILQMVERGAGMAVPRDDCLNIGDVILNR